MKKVILSFVLMGPLIGGTFSNARAQEKKLSFSLNLGVQTLLYRESSFDNAWFTLDARVGLALGKFLEISPEVMFTTDDSLEFDVTWFYPGLLLNLRLGDFFVGAGAVLPIVFYERGSESGNLAPKVNIGYSAGPFALTAYLFTWTEEYLDFLEFNFIGATIGYKF
jgi:predicted membrane protein